MEWFDKLLVHWPFISVMMIFMLIGFVASRRIFTEAHVKKAKSGKWFWWWMRKTLPLHPVLSGILLGFFWKLPEPGVDTPIEQSAYFGFAGALSVFLYEVGKGFAKKKGYDISLPGESQPPPESKS